MNSNKFYTFFSNINGPFFLWEIDLIYTKNKLILIYFNGNWITYKSFRLKGLPDYFINETPPKSPFFIKKFFLISLKKLLKNFFKIHHLS